ncbi:MAG: hypothetical protein DMF98_28005 [Acidobacteria bacterium]|nr:MAG: hypothetical protein DMF98_28005 [Acidobacteriota bacterium]
MTIKITANDKGNPPGKLADAELHFSDGPLEGLKLIGFSIWERRVGPGRNVTFPARQYSVNGVARSSSRRFRTTRNAPQSRVRERHDRTQRSQGRKGRPDFSAAFAAFAFQNGVRLVGHGPWRESGDRVIGINPLPLRSLVRKARAGA